MARSSVTHTGNRRTTELASANGEFDRSSMAEEQRNLGVKAVDIFGKDAMTIVEVAV